jgi:iron complex outermembrane receptor protein
MNSTWTATCVYVTAVLLHVCFVNSIAEAEPLLDSTPAFRIPPQPLPSALAQFSEQCGVQVTSSAALVEQKPSKGVAGRIDARAALKKLLEGTGLEFEVIDGETVVIVPARVKAAPRPTEQPLTDVKNERGISEGHEVLVTGSHIRTTRSSASPVFSFDQQDFLDSGTTSIQAFMRTVPQNFNGGRTEASAAVSDYRHGGRDNLTQGSGINIRGLGNESTLVLLNGRRLAPGGFGAFYDVSTIPLSAVERIDVLADGSSAIYGSDAIGGVVNIILRNKFDGAQTTLGYGGVTHGDLRELTANQLFGTELDRGSILLNLDYAHRDPLRAKDRNFAHRIWTGSNDLLPEERRLSGLISAHQEITSTLRVSLDAYATDREADSDHSPVGLNNQMHTQAETKHVGGTAWS